MNFARPAFIHALCCRVAAAAIFVVPAFGATPGAHQTVVQPGGVPGWPVIAGVDRSSNSMTIHWDGPEGYYRLFQKKGPNDKNWTQVGGPMLGRKTTITTMSSNAFFRVSGPSPRYAGSQVCMECHENVHTNTMHTRHAHAYETLKSIGQHGNAQCLPCHTVGYGLPTGFSLTSPNVRLAGVQCENCHGPSAEHAANEEDLTVRPRRDIAAQICGGCHTDSHHPTYDEFSQSGHFRSAQDLTPAEADRCGRCHSGTARLALLEGKSALTVSNDLNVGITCVVCHDPHKNTPHPAQLRNPLASTKDFSLGTSGDFAEAYQADVNICAQCHNHRGASYTSSARAPHHSPQYNMLIGTVGELESGAKPNQPGGHARMIEKQCVGCHMQTEEYVNEEHHAVKGHSFRVESYDSCGECHPFPELLTAFTMVSVSNQVQQVKRALDLWAATKAPEALRVKYGARAWEYTTPGSLSSGGSGPNASEQGQIPVNIRKARFNLYLVQYDGSFGVHNGPYAITLLDTARKWIATELNP